MKKPLILLLLFLSLMQAYSQVIPDQSMMMARSPGSFRAEFKTTEGTFVIEVIRDWSPMGADRLYQLLATGFYNQNGIFRVQKNYVVQFGICDQEPVNTFWDKRPVPDEPRLVQNLKGSISYARDGANSRTAQLFINLKDNVKLDTVNYNGVRGFTPVARIIEGYETVEKFFGGYGFEPAKFQDSIMVKGNSYLKRVFPEIDFILEAKIISE